MAENKTKPTNASIAKYLSSRANEQQRADCTVLMAMFKKLTRQKPRMWGPSIIGYGVYRYTYESGRSGEMPLIGFAIRGRQFVIYIFAESTKQKELLSKLGKYSMGKVCLYIKCLSDVNLSVLEKLVINSVAEVRQRYGEVRTA